MASKLNTKAAVRALANGPLRHLYLVQYLQQLKKDDPNLKLTDNALPLVEAFAKDLVALADGLAEFETVTNRYAHKESH